MKLVLVFCLFFVHIKGWVGCGDDYDRSRWNCNDYNYYFAAENLVQTMNCIGRNKMVAFAEKPTQIFVNRKIFRFDELDVEKQTITFREFLSFQVVDSRLTFDHPDNCTDHEYPPEYFFNFVPRTVFKFDDVDSSAFSSVILSQVRHLRYI